VGGLYGCGVFLGIMEAMLDVGISGLRSSIESVLLVLLCPVLIVLGLCIWKYYDYKWTKLWEEWKQY